MAGFTTSPAMLSRKGIRLRFRYLVLIPLFLAFFLPSKLHAQEGMTVLKANPLSLLMGTANVQMERTLGERFSVQMGLFLGAKNLEDNNNPTLTPIEYRWLGLTPEVRYHTTFNKRSAPAGVFFGFFVRYRRIQQDYGAYMINPETPGMDLEATVTTRDAVIGPGSIMGYHFVFDSGFSMEGFLGAQFGFRNRTDEILCEECNGNETIRRAGFPYRGLEWRAGIALGYAF